MAFIMETCSQSYGENFNWKSQVHALVCREHGKNGYPTSEKHLEERLVGRVRDVEIFKDGSILILNDEQDGGLFQNIESKVNRSTECFLLYLVRAGCT